MNLGLRAILLLVAGILFLVAAFGDDNDFDLLAIGLALMAFGLIVDELGLGRRLTRR
jgi:hypothetical protein